VSPVLHFINFQHEAHRFASRPAGRLGETALHYVCQQGARDMVELLLAYGADAGAKNAFGESPLHHAAMHPDGDMMLSLLRKAGNALRARETYRGKTTPLHLAAPRGHIEVVKKLIEFKANAGARNEWGLPPVLLSVKAPEAAMLVAQADPAWVPLLADDKKKKKGGKGGKKKKK
jgi:hypothetical protein